jgi:hypothetical protein
MKKRSIKFIWFFVLGLFLAVSGCSSITDQKQDNGTVVNVDPLWDEINENDYESVSSGYIISEDKSLSAIVYKRLINEESTFTSKSSYLIAFFDTNDETDYPIKTILAPRFEYGGVYPVDLHLMDWNDPYDGRKSIYISFFINPNEYFPDVLNLDGFSSDINRNGFPEFSSIGAYCPVSCSDVYVKLDFFEVRDTSDIINLTDNLPGQIILPPRSTDPLNYYVIRRYPYQRYRNIEVPLIYEWIDDKFIDVSSKYYAELLTTADEIESSLVSSFGEPFDYHDQEALEILLLYEHAGYREKALEVFLMLTEYSNWPNTSALFNCWLQLSRAIAMEDFENNLEFSLPPNPDQLISDSEEIITYYSQLDYDVTYCQNLQ